MGEPKSDVLQFYEGSKVLITGGTGFFGKILIEKLLRSTSVSTIYMLVRPKKEKNISERLYELFDNVIFSKLKEKDPKFLERIVKIQGDFSIPGLGISDDDRETLKSNVNIVFNVAATVRLEEHIKVAYTVHVHGTEEILKLCHQMKQLKSCMHVSTSYTNCYLNNIEEKLYDYDVNYEEIGHLIANPNLVIDKSFTRRIIGQWPNTYSFTKALGESVIKNRSNGLPTGVFRPSIVLPTFKEPIPGWIDNMYGPTGLIVATNMGILRNIYGDGTKIADLVPVDMCVSSMIVAAWEIGSGRKYDRTPENIPVYNYVSAPENPITWDEFYSLTDYHAVKYPSGKAMWVAWSTLTKEYRWHLFFRMIYHIIPALLFDIVSILLRKRLRLLPMYRRIHKMSDLCGHFGNREWTFSNDNVVRLWNSINDYEKELFPFSMKNFNWLTYFRTYYVGLRLYLMKETLDNIQTARKRKQIFIILQHILRGSLYFCASILIWSIIKRIF